MTGFSRSERYSAVAASLHWLLAVMLLFQIGLGAWMTSLPLGLEKYRLFQLHKSVGMLILGLSLARLGWRLAVAPPALAATLRAWERALAHAVHWALYGFMVLTRCSDGRRSRRRLALRPRTSSASSCCRLSRSSKAPARLGRKAWGMCMASSPGRARR